MDYPTKKICMSCGVLHKSFEEFNSCDSCFQRFLFRAIQNYEQFDFEFVKAEMEKINIKLDKINKKLKLS